MHSYCTGERMKQTQSTANGTPLQVCVTACAPVTYVTTTQYSHIFSLAHSALAIFCGTDLIPDIMPLKTEHAHGTAFFFARQHTLKKGITVSELG